MLTYRERSELCTNSTAKRLFQLMDKKKTNLALSVDVTKKEEFLSLADTLGSEICVLKTHIDIVEDFDQTLISELTRLAKKHQFIIFEDRKFADIGNTVKLQYAKGIYHIADWAAITNAHMVPGPGIITGLKQIGLAKGNGLLLLAEMSSVGTLASGDYTKETLRQAEQHKDFVIGFISRHKLVDDPRFLHMTPGVKIETSEDKLGQQYLTPDEVIAKRGNDIIIVGRGIYEAKDPKQEASKYRAAGWSAYLNRLKISA